MIIPENKITIIAFNIGYAGTIVNGPGISLHTFIKYLQRENEDLKIDLFTYLKPKEFADNINWFNLLDKNNLRKSIKTSGILHHWSGMSNYFKEAIIYANNLNKPVAVGPNVIDCVDKTRETFFLFKLKIDIFFAMNEKIKYGILKYHDIPLDIIKILMVGPDIELWKPREGKRDTILWKGNSKHFVKDIDFALKVKEKLPQYKFEFLGYPGNYNYFSHIDSAKNNKLYFCTSLSETMCISMIEQWAAGIPSVTHPKIYLHGKNYSTGIITNRDVNSYCDAIMEIMSNYELYKKLSNGAKSFAITNFNSERIYKKYMEYIKNVC